METCECRTMAIARCGQCQKPICMHHSRLFDTQTLCLAHNKEAVDRRDAHPAPPPPVEPEPPKRRLWGRRP